MENTELRDFVASICLIVVSLYTGYCYGRYKAGKTDEVDYNRLSDSASVLDESGGPDSSV